MYRVQGYKALCVFQDCNGVAMDGSPLLLVSFISFVDDENMKMNGRAFEGWKCTEYRVAWHAWMYCEYFMPLRCRTSSGYVDSSQFDHF